MLFMISNTTQICWKIFCIMKFQRFIAIYRLWRPSWTPLLLFFIIAFPMWDLVGLLVCYLWYQILPKSVEKPFVAICWGLNCRLILLGGCPSTSPTDLWQPLTVSFLKALTLWIEKENYIHQHLKECILNALICHHVDFLSNFMSLGSALISWFELHSS